MKKAFYILLLLLTAAGLARVRGTQAQAEPLLIPIGGGYSDIYSGLCASIVQRAADNTVNIVVLPSAYSTSADTISEGERQLNLTDAERRRFEVQEACKRAGPEGLVVNATVAPVFTRADALLPENAAYFEGDISAVFILGGDQTVAMRSIGNTVVEQAMAEAYQRGAIFSGTSAGAGMLSSSMLAGYRPNFSAESALKFGAAEVWADPSLHGLPFSLPNAVIDQHFFQRARVGRLLNAILQPDVPHVGIGVDAYTGVHIYGSQRVGEVFGLYTVAVLDAETYHAARTVRYVGEEHLLSARNVLVHLLAKEGASYDLVSRQSSLGASPARLERSSDFLVLPEGAGALFIGGDLGASLPGSPVLAQFEEAAGGQGSSILLITTGYRSGTAANAAAKKYQAGLVGSQQVLFVAAEQLEPAAIPEGTTGILVTGKDQSLLNPVALALVEEAWLGGLPVFFDGAAAAMVGEVYSNHEPTPNEGEEQEVAAQRSFLQGRTQFGEGLGLVPAMFEPSLVNNNRWGRLFSLAYNHPQRAGFGLSEGTAILLEGETARVIGSSTVFSLDLRNASLGLGSNQGFEIANGLLDTFQPGDTLQYEIADTAAIYTAPATPDLETILATPTPLPTATAAPTATATAVPTVTQAPTETRQPATAVPTSTVIPVVSGEQAVGGSPGYLPVVGAAAVGIILLAWLRKRKA